jgi:hypothetical protein
LRALVWLSFSSTQSMFVRFCLFDLIFPFEHFLLVTLSSLGISQPILFSYFSLFSSSRAGCRHRHATGVLQAHCALGWYHHVSGSAIAPRARDQAALPRARPQGPPPACRLPSRLCRLHPSANLPSFISCPSPLPPPPFPCTPL